MWQSLLVCNAFPEASTGGTGLSRPFLGMESFVGQGAAEAARRRQQTLSLERQEARERQAHALSLSQGRNILGRGFFRLD